jgi:hypothetical protein
MPYVIRVLGFADRLECPFTDQFLMQFDFEADNGRGFGVFTPDVAKAKRFATTAEAMRFWNTRSKTRPTRPDGKPNKPFSATTCEVIDTDKL